MSLKQKKRIRDKKPSDSFYVSSDGFVKVFPFRNQKIGDILGEDQVEKMDSEHPAMIIGPPGLGKSWFAFHVVIPVVIREGKRVLILVSRTALSYQYKIQAIEEYAPNLAEELTSEGIKRRQRYGPVDVYTYQGFRLQLLAGKVNTRGYGAVIFDEVHYFTQDAAFDNLTELTLEETVKQLHHCKRLYMTATPEMIEDVLIEVERRNRSRLSRLPAGYVIDQPALHPCIRIYKFETDYSYITPVFFSKDSDILETIRESSQKFLVCVDSKERGQMLQSELGDTVAEYIDAELKNTIKSDAVDTMVMQEKFQKRVLIATSFLDVGVNLNDRELKNIVIYSTCKTHFVQAIGRKRKCPDEEVTLFIHIPSLKDLNILRGRIAVKLQEMDKGMETFKNTCDVAVSSLPFPMFAREKQGSLYVSFNTLSFTYYRMRFNEIEAISKAAEEATPAEVAIADSYLGWLGLDMKPEECTWLGRKPDEKFREMEEFLLEKARGEAMDSEAFKIFQTLIVEFNLKYQIEPGWRKDRPPHLERINKFIKKCGLTFTVTSEGSPRKYLVERR